MECLGRFGPYMECVGNGLLRATSSSQGSQRCFRGRQSPLLLLCAQVSAPVVEVAAQVVDAAPQVAEDVAQLEQ